MDYKKKLLEIIFSDDDDYLDKWLQKQPLEEHPEILNQFHTLMQQMMLEKEAYEIADTLQELDERIQKYTDAVIVELAAKADYEKALAAQEASWQEALKKMEGVREYVIECIVTNADNAAAMRGLAEHVIDFEKKSEVYDPKNWEVIYKK